MPAKGPIRAFFVELMISSSKLGSLAFSSSRASVMPGMTEPSCGSVLKKVMLRLSASERPFLSSP